MFEDIPQPSDEMELKIQREAGLVNLPNGGLRPLSEIINRSLAHVQTCKRLEFHERRAGEEQEFEIAPGVKIVMCWIPPGEFLMGSPEDEKGRHDYETQHRVAITQGFWLAKTQTTQSQWEAVMGNNPSYFKGSDLPVESVSWNDISESAGFMEKVNRLAAAGVIFSLPTEAQWEYACRAGTVTALNSGENLISHGACPNLNEVAWHMGNNCDKTHPVGQKKANDWGLHDMHGNVWEWCADWYEDYTDGPLVDPLGPESGSERVLRGGSWLCVRGAGGYRAASRNRKKPSHPGISYGFRIAAVQAF